MRFDLSRCIARVTAIESEVAKRGSAKKVLDIHFCLTSRGPSGGRQLNFDVCEFTKIEVEEGRFATVVAGFPNYGAQEPNKRPNKSPEPTPTAVTPRAMEMKAERKKSKFACIEARVAPAVVVAHL